MRFHLGSDHGGTFLRQILLDHLVAEGHEVLSCGGPTAEPGKPIPSVDYPDVAREVCARVLADPGSLGLLVCGTGQGMAMSANGVAGIRAGVVSDVFSARMTRAHNDANVLCLGERVLGTELAKLLVSAFAETQFIGGRHQRRVDKIAAEAGRAPDGQA